MRTKHLTSSWNIILLSFLRFSQRTYVVLQHPSPPPVSPPLRGALPINAQHDKNHKQYPPETDSWRRSDTALWAGIASFRDARCGATLFNLFSKADYPDRVTAGVVQQNLEGDEGCLSKYCKLMEEKVHACLFCWPV